MAHEDHCKIGYEEQSDWYFFSYKDRKYPTGTRTNRATLTGFWKATGRDKAVRDKHARGLIGMRKTLVFYTGRAPNGRKTDWIMHEYRLETDENAIPQACLSRIPRESICAASLILASPPLLRTCILVSLYVLLLWLPQSRRPSLFAGDGGGWDKGGRARSATRKFLGWAVLGYSG
jgi:hypothetical protein